MNITISIGVASFIVIAIGIIQFLLAEWTKSRIQNSIKHEYDQKIEEYRAQIRMRENCAKIAEVLARAHYGDGKEPREFMQLVWELSLWLPPEQLCQLSTLLIEKKGSPKDLIVSVRKIFHGSTDSIKPENLIHLGPPVPQQNPQP
jgi:hypothetical protein